MPNGWRIAPAGRHVTVGDLPLNIVQSADSRYLVVTNNGLDKPTLSVVDVASWSVKNTVTIDYTGNKSISKSEILDRFKERKVNLSPESQSDGQAKVLRVTGPEHADG